MLHGFQAPDILVVSDEEKEEPAEESTFVPVEPEGMFHK